MQSYEKAWLEFNELHKQTVNALKVLKEMVIEEGSKSAQKKMISGNFDEAKDIVEQLELMTRIEFESNIEDIQENIETLIQSDAFQKEDKEASIASPKPSRYTATKEKSTRTKVRIEKKPEELTQSDSFEEKAVHLLEQRGFKIVEKDETGLVCIGNNNKRYYLTYDNGSLSTEGYNNLLDERNKYKNIGFICLNKSILDRKTKKAINDWVMKNKTLCDKFLTIHCTTLDDIEQSRTIFDSITF